MPIQRASLQTRCAPLSLARMVFRVTATCMIRGLPVCRVPTPCDGPLPPEPPPLPEPVGPVPDSLSEKFTPIHGCQI